MTELIQEYVNSGEHVARIDPQRGVLYGVKILGNESRNGRIYPDETLRNAVSLYENVKVNVNHPEGNPKSPRNYQDRIGYICSVTLRETRGLYADFHFNPKHALAEQLLWDARHSPENVGFSHNVEAVLKHEDGNVVVDRIVSVRSVDLVADPATTTGLFECYETETERCDCGSGERDSFLCRNTTAHENHEVDTEDSPARNRETTADEGTRKDATDEREILCEYVFHELKRIHNPLASLLDPRFRDSLRSQKHETQIRTLIEERISLVNRIPKYRPQSVSRELFESESETIRDSRSFVRAITEHPVTRAGTY